MLAGAATVLWAVCAALFATTDAGDGVNIGAALLGLLATPLSVVSLVLLIGSARAAQDAVGPKGRDARVGTPLAMASLVLFAATWVFGGSANTTATATALLAVLVGAVVTFVVSAALFLPPRSNRS